MTGIAWLLPLLLLQPDLDDTGGRVVAPPQTKASRAERQALEELVRREPIPVGALAPPTATPVAYSEPRRRDGRPLTCAAAVLADVETGQILYAREVTRRLYPASTTKVMTTLLALEAVEAGRAKLTDRLEIDPESAAVAESGLWMTPGEHLTLRELLVGVMVRSANDASHAIARYLGGGSAQAFVDAMNRRAAELGCVDTHFMNPHGLHLDLTGQPLTDQHHTTAYDLLRITFAAWRHPFFRELCLMDGVPVSWENVDPDPKKKHPPTRLIHNRNRLLDVYSECVGVKTGYTKQAGACLISAARRGDREVLAVTLRSASGGDRWLEGEALLRYGLDEYARETVLEEGQLVANVPVLGGEVKAVPVVATESITVVRHRQDPRPPCRARVSPRLTAPFVSGLPVGWAVAEVPTGEPVQVSLVTTRDVPGRHEGGASPTLWAFGLLMGVFGYGAATEAHRRRGNLLPARG